MKSVKIFQHGGPEVLEYVETELPTPMQGEIRVQALAIGASRTDVLIRDGSYKWAPTLPAILGNEMCGVIESVGNGVAADLIGKRVLISSRELSKRGGCYAEFICVNEDAIYYLPENISDADALSLPNFQLAQAMLLNRSNYQEQKTILVTGAAGGVAIALAQTAKLFSMDAIGTASSDEKAIFAQENGFHSIVKYTTEDIPTRIFELTGGRGVDLAFDHVGGEIFFNSIKSLAPGGLAILYSMLVATPEAEVFKLLRKYREKSLGIKCFSMHMYDSNREIRRKLMNDAISSMALGRVSAPKSISFPLCDAVRVHELFERGGSLGKMVLIP